MMRIEEWVTLFAGAATCLAVGFFLGYAAGTALLVRAQRTDPLRWEVSSRPEKPSIEDSDEWWEDQALVDAQYLLEELDVICVERLDDKGHYRLSTLQQIDAEGASLQNAVEQLRHKVTARDRLQEPLRFEI